MKPVIKWVGGKSQLTQKIREMLPDKFETYYEPFLGGAAVLLDLNPVDAVVNDINPELINMYLQIKNNVEEVIDWLDIINECREKADDKKQYYYTERQMFNEHLGEQDGAEGPRQAARFLYLNKHCFNGLYRVNSKGEFNVPFNGKISGKFFDPDHLRELSSRLQNMRILNTDFETAVAGAKESDLVYFDPPYDYECEDGFVDYSSTGWTREDTTKLKLLCDQLTAKGCYVILSNNSTTFIRELFNDDRYLIEEIPVRRAINCKGTGRGPVREVIITNYNPRSVSYDDE